MVQQLFLVNPRSSSLGNARDRLRAIDLVMSRQAMGLYA